MQQPTEVDDYVTIEEGATRLKVSERTVWDLLRRTPVVRYRRPGFGKTTFVLWGDLEQAYRTPRPIQPRDDELDAKKVAA
jgi:hypothetical protein